LNSVVKLSQQRYGAICGENCVILSAVVLSQYTRVTHDGEATTTDNTTERCITMFGEKPRRVAAIAEFTSIDLKPIVAEFTQKTFISQARIQKYA